MAYVMSHRERDTLRAFASLPLVSTLRNGQSVELIEMPVEAREPGRQMLNDEIVNACSYPQNVEQTIEQFTAYFCSHEAFAVRVTHPASTSTSTSTLSAVADNSLPTFEIGEVLGVFYIKPNFPGRCDHICNAGFLVKPSARRQGVAKFMARSFMQLARDLGYEASFFNLVFTVNTPSIELWRSLGFKEIGVVPKAARLADGSYSDAVQFYYDLTTIPLSPLK
jgi:GNAT superfamily N-acetyltransferase